MDHFLVDYENIGEAGLKGVEDLGPDTSTVIFYSEHADKISFDMHQTLCRCRSKLEFRKAQTGKKNALDFQLSTYLGYLVASHPGDRFFIISKDNGYHVVMDFWDSSSIQQLDYIGRAYEKPARQAQAAAHETQPVQKTTNEAQKQQPKEPSKQEVPAQEPSKAEAPGQEAPRQEAPRQEVTRQEIPRQDAPRHETQPQPQKQDAPKQEPPKQQQPKQETSNKGRRRGSSHKESSSDEFKPSEELMNQLSQLIESREERENIGRFIVRYKTKQGVNNAIVKLYGTEKAGELYRKIKPLLKDKKGK